MFIVVFLVLEPLWPSIMKAVIAIAGPGYVVMYGYFSLSLSLSLPLLSLSLSVDLCISVSLYLSLSLSISAVPTCLSIHVILFQSWR